MGWFAALPALSQTMVGITAAASVGGGYASHQAGQVQSDALKAQAREERDAAREREVERKRRLISALSSQSAMRGAQGGDIGVGSLRAVAQSDIKTAERDSLYDARRTSARRRSLLTSASAARRQGNIEGAVTLADASLDIMRMA